MICIYFEQACIYPLLGIYINVLITLLTCPNMTLNDLRYDTWDRQVDGHNQGQPVMFGPQHVSFRCSRRLPATILIMMLMIPKDNTNTMQLMALFLLLSLMLLMMILILMVMVVCRRRTGARGRAGKGTGGVLD